MLKIRILVKYLIQLFIIFLCDHTYSQQISNFNTLHNENGVLVSWVTDSGYICDNLQLFHSSDSIFFNEIYIIPGICGSFSESIAYSFLHTNAPVGRNIYKLIYSNGSDNYFTNIIVPDKQNLQFYPNPVMNYSTIINPIYNGEPYIISIFDFSGKMIFQIQTASVSQTIDFSSFTAGSYIFELKMENWQFQNKLIVTH